MKTQNEKTSEIIKSGKGNIFNHIKMQYTNQCQNDNLTGNTLIELISNNATGIVKEIAGMYVMSNLNPTKSEASLMSCEIDNNKTKYLEAMASHTDECRNAALEVLRDIYPAKCDSELKQMIG